MGSALSKLAGLFDGWTFASIADDLVSFLAKFRVTALSDYKTALADVSNILIGLSAVLTIVNVTRETGSPLKGALAGGVDLVASLVAGAVSTAIFGAFVAAGITLPIVGVIAIAATVAIIATVITNFLIDLIVTARLIRGSQRRMRYA